MKRAEQDNKLQSGLQAYADSVEASGALTGFRQRLGNWPVYAAAAGSALAFSTSATANTIVFDGPGIDAGSFGVFLIGSIPTNIFSSQFRSRAFGLAFINGRSISMYNSEPKAFGKSHLVTSKGSFRPADAAILDEGRLAPPYFF